MKKKIMGIIVVIVIVLGLSLVIYNQIRIGYRIHVLVKLQDLTLYKNAPHYFALLSLHGDIIGAYYNLFRVQ